MSNASTLNLNEERSLTAAVMVMLGTEGLRFPGLDAVGGEIKHGPLPLTLPDLLLLTTLAEGDRTLGGAVDEVAARTGADAALLHDLLAKLWERSLLTAPGYRRPDRSEHAPRVADADLNVRIAPPATFVIVVPRFFRLSHGAFEHIDHDSRLRARFTPLELAAASEFRRPSTMQSAYDAHRAVAGALALDEAQFEDVVRRLASADLLDRTDDEPDDGSGPVLRRGRPTIGGERAANRDWQRFQHLNELMRQSVREGDAVERAHEAATRRKRVRVVSVHQNGTIPPLALGMIVAAAKVHEGGRLNDHYFFHPDWLVRPSKVRALANRPAIYLLSNYNWCHRHNMMVSKKVKQLSPWSVTVHGGPNTPKYEGDTEAYFHENPDVDVTVRGEGEAVVCEILDALAGCVGDGPPDLSGLRDVRGISFRDGIHIVRTPERERIMDLAAIPSPMLTGLFEAYASTELAIFESNRGCPYSCTFCDWGSAIGTKIRQFPLERVFAELEWCAQHQIAGIMCADANFGIFERDVLIAEKVAELKARYGYPNGFSVSSAKNTTTHTKKIIQILADAGVMSKGSIGVQSMDAPTLATVRRSNIKVDKYDELTKEFRDAGLSLWVDLMFGLPGQTVASFQNDLQGCIDRGVFPRMFRTQLLVNSPMNEPAYREKHRIVTEPSADGSQQLIVSTATFTREDFEEMNSLRLAFLLCDVIGMLRHIAHYVRSETGVREIDFYERLRRDVREDPERWPTLAFSVRALLNLLVAPVSWSLPIAEAGRYVTEVWGLEDDAALQTVMAVQLAVLPAARRNLPQTLSLTHDYSAWHKEMVRATQSGHQHDWHAVVPKLREFAPGTFSVDDPDHLCDLGIGATVDGDLFGNYELRSSVARWRQAIFDVRSGTDPMAAAAAVTAMAAEGICGAALAMRVDTPSLMAQSVAMVRAAHQILDHPLVLEDRLALAIVGKEAGAQLTAAPERFETPGSRHIRAFMAARSRYAEDELALALRRGATQYVLLGAGLDTYVYRRSDTRSTLRVFEVDHPVTQSWKRERLETAAIPIPPAVVFVSIDLETSSLAASLENAGFDRERITFFSWLGMTPYLPPAVVDATLELIASLPSGSGVVFDYAVEGSALGPVERIALKVLMKRVARAGEPFQTFFEPHALAAMLAAKGFQDVEDLGPAEIDERYFRNRTDGLSVSAGLARLVRARV